ncbi:MAG: GNAT family N-acetyltransferase [Sciscionella sp.]
MVTIRALECAELPAAVALLARGMLDNPVNVAAFGSDPRRRERSLQRLFGTLFRGPVAVAPDRHGHGCGSALLNAYCRALDAAGEVSYLETDKSENVPFYQRNGYAAVAEADVIGVPNWFMIRRPVPPIVA